PRGSPRASDRCLVFSMPHLATSRLPARPSLRRVIRADNSRLAIPGLAPCDRPRLRGTQHLISRMKLGSSPAVRGRWRAKRAGGGKRGRAFRAVRSASSFGARPPPHRSGGSPPPPPGGGSNERPGGRGGGGGLPPPPPPPSPL